MLGIGLGLNKLRSSGLANYLAGAMVWGFKSKFKWNDTSTDIWGFANPNDIDPEAQAVYDRIIADGGVSDLSRLNFFVKGLKAIYGDLANVPVCYDAHWIGYKLGSGTGATAGQAAAKLYSLTVAGDAVQSTAASQPLLLAHNGDNYWWGSGVTGNYVSTPNAAANQITGDIEIIAKLNTKYVYGGGVQRAVVSKYQAGVESFVFTLRDDGLLRWESWNSGGTRTISVFSSVAISATDNTNLWVKVSVDVDNGASNSSIYFYTSTDGVTYTQLGTTQNGGSATNIRNANTPVEVGSIALGTLIPFIGKISRATISNTIGGAPVVDFNPSQYNASTSQTAWTSSTGEIWTISTGTATSGYKGVLVNRTIVMGDGVDDTISSGTLTSRQYFTSYSSAKVYLYGATPDKIIYGSSTNSHVLYGNLSMFAFNGVNLVSGNTSTNLNSQTVDFNSITSKIRINAGSDVLGSSGAQTSTNCKLFNSGSSFGNVILNTLIQPSSLDSDATKTATYNLIRSLNNNAF